jgi:hypothetical protein
MFSIFARSFLFWPVPLERKGGVWYYIYVVLPLGNIGLGGKRCGLWWAERRFPSFRFEIVMHLVDTAPNDFRF